MQPNIYVSALESVYLLYMFWWFETSLNFDRSTLGGRLDVGRDSVLYHSTNNDYGPKICPFGRWAVLLLVFMLLGRHCWRMPTGVVTASLVISFFLSFLNLNAVVYLLPVWATEGWALCRGEA
tara:strand:- start:276 stop:644 length:369 start_codon:yes stop_codon:yes gene_type:complete